MISVLLTILKIIGIILLCILGLLLIILLTLLFAPIHYSISASYKGRALASVKVNWILCMVRFRLNYENSSLQYGLKFLWIRLWPRAVSSGRVSKKKPGSKKTVNKPAAEVPPAGISDDVSRSAANNAMADIKPDTKADDAVSDTDYQETPETSQKVPKKSFHDKLKDRMESVRSLINKIRFKITGICDKIKAGDLKLHHYRDLFEDESSRRALHELILRAGRLLKHILPRRFRAYIHFGMENPADTGELLGAACMFCPLYGSHIILDPDFENKCFDGNLKTSGHIQLFFVIYAALRIYFSKDIKRLYGQLKK